MFDFGFNDRILVNLFKDNMIMQTEIELKEKLIEKINSTDDVELLKELLLVIDFESKSEDVYEMSPGEIEAVNEGLKQFKNGQWITHEESNKRVDEWLKKYDGQ
jgi:hypothetical protein